MLLLSRNQHEVPDWDIAVSVHKYQRDLQRAPGCPHLGRWDHISDMLQYLQHTDQWRNTGDRTETNQNLARGCRVSAGCVVLLVAAKHSGFFFVLHRCWEIFGLCCCVHRRVKNQWYHRQIKSIEIPCKRRLRMTAELWGKSKLISDAAFTCRGTSSPHFSMLQLLTASAIDTNANTANHLKSHSGSRNVNYVRPPLPYNRHTHLLAFLAVPLWHQCSQTWSEKQLLKASDEGVPKRHRLATWQNW